MGITKGALVSVPEALVKRVEKSQPTMGFSFTLTTRETRETSKAELVYDWDVLREWAEKTLSVTSQARMLFEAEKDFMSVSEAVSKFVVIRRLLDDELRQRGL